MSEQKNVVSKKVPAIATDVVDGNLELVFSNGQTLRVYLDQLAPEIVKQAIIHGLKQKLVDAAAISCDPETGRAATIDTKFKAVKEVFDRITDKEAPEWNKRREGGAQSGGMLFRALIKYFDGRKSDAEIKTWLEGKTEAEKLALRKNEKIAAIIDTLREPKAGGVDTDALLDELEAPVVEQKSTKAKKS
jgi:hypothetical protein